VSFRIIAIIAAIDSLVFGAIGLAVPGQISVVFMDMQLDPTAEALVRLACSAYIGYAIIAWLLRDVGDPGIQRAVALANTVAWGLSAGVVAVAVASGIGTSRVWILAGMQVVFAIAWAATLLRIQVRAPRTA
jgi:hypothetical protein